MAALSLVLEPAVAEGALPCVGGRGLQTRAPPQTILSERKRISSSSNPWQETLT